jgi:capsid protein
VRKTVRQRARYEALENNSYAKGMILAFANQLIGTGPRLQLSTRDKKANTRVERSFARWAESISLAEKLRTMANAYVVDGEPFAMFVTNQRVEHEVKLDVVPLECDYFEPSYTGGSGTTDGADFDDFNNPIRWHRWAEHPGESLTFSNLKSTTTPVDASQVIHIHRPDRPGQRRGVSHLVTALPLFAMHRRFKLATLAAAETAANFAGIMHTTNPAQDSATPGNDAEWMTAIPLEHRALLPLPEGWDMRQLKAEHPNSTLQMFENSIIGELARCLLQPLNIAIGSSKDHNFSSGKLDRLGWNQAINVERSRWVCRAINRIVQAWLDEAALVNGLLPFGVGPMAEWGVGYTWDSADVVDEEKQAKADNKDLVNGTTTRTTIYNRRGKDIDIEDQVGADENGVTLEEYRRGIWSNRIGAPLDGEEQADDAADRAKERANAEA